jgi:hypothetical protein
VSRFGVALQWEVRRQAFLTIRGEAAYAGSALTSDSRVYALGAGAGIGALTALGPVELMVSGGPYRRPARIEVSLGHTF